MHVFDGCVFPYPSGTVSIARYARELSSLGFSGCVAASMAPVNRIYDIPVWTARYLTEVPARLLSREAGRAIQVNDLVYVQAGDAGYNRNILTTQGVHVMTNLHTTPKDGFDRYCAQLAAEREIGVDLSVRPLIELRDGARQKVIRRYEEIFTLQNRYEFPIVLSSHAADITHLKSPREMIRLFSLVWKDENLLWESLESICLIKNRTGPVVEI
ncbi:MAG: Ribonuclease P protein component 3 [Euryarchaeota archaeon ADurb.Bin294]|nr:MAG: Ribonuclease P protein component 3 [Euryarchaeota archaeon ADurb.Bin294]